MKVPTACIAVGLYSRLCIPVALHSCGLGSIGFLDLFGETGVNARSVKKMTSACWVLSATGFNAR